MLEPPVSAGGVASLAFDMHLFAQIMHPAGQQEGLHQDDAGWFRSINLRKCFRSVVTEANLAGLGSSRKTQAALLYLPRSIARIGLVTEVVIAAFMASSLWRWLKTLQLSGYYILTACMDSFSSAEVRLLDRMLLDKAAVP
jgi:hypothetical protein